MFSARLVLVSTSVLNIPKVSRPVIHLRGVFSASYANHQASGTSRTTPKMDPAAVSSFQDVLAKSTRILALCGAGLSAASGLPTFRGAGGMWKNHEATDLATPEAFKEDPGLVWQFYAYRRHMALKAKPNPAHFALAKLAEKMKGTDGFACLTQNVDGEFNFVLNSHSYGLNDRCCVMEARPTVMVLVEYCSSLFISRVMLTHSCTGLSPRAGHPASQLHLLHGSLMDIKCFNPKCSYFDENNLDDPLCPALEVSSLDPSSGDKTGAEATASLYKAMNLSTEASKPDTVPKVSELPRCPKCKKSLLRPGVVWFGEELPQETIRTIEEWISKSKKIDLMLVVGTTAEVYPAAGYIEKARRKGARVAVINMDASHLGGSGSLQKGDWMFEGDAGVLVPKLLEKEIGKV